MNETDTNLKLLAGLPVEIDGLGQLRQLTAKEVVIMNESLYNQYLSALLFDKSNIEQLQDEQETNFNMLVAVCYHDPQFKEMFLKALELFFGEKARFFINDEHAFFYFGEITDKRYLDADKLQLIQKLLRKMNNLQDKEEEEYNAGNEMARKLIEKIRRNKKKNAPPSQEKINLHSLISALAWKSNGISITNIWDLTLYQIYDGYVRTENIDNYSNVIRGIYAGTINGKDIDLSKINWANIIKIN